MSTRQIVVEVPEKVLLTEKMLAGMPRVEFLLGIQRYKIFPFEAELDKLESECC